MPSHPNPGRRLRRVALVALLLSATPAAFAQTAAYPAGATVQYIPQPDDPGERLAAALRTLATNPNDLNALVAAGQNAVILGDPNAAVGFFGRAGSLAPRDGRVKAGLGSALVQLEKPQEAQRLFQEAASLGVPVADFAADRGLAYDLTGDTRRAQADYQAVLAAHPEDDGTRRRLALSQGIAGDRKGAIATLDPLIRKRDIAAWRAQTFVLAMTGDAAGANDITRIMLPQQQAALQPFLQRLATLSPADKARAVHFGEMPAAGRAYSETQLANTGAPATYAPAPVRSAPAPQVASAAPVRPAYRPAPAPAPAATAASDLAPATASSAPSVAAGTGYATAPLAGIALSTGPSPAATAPPPAAPPPSVVATTDVPASTPAPSVASGLPIGSTGTEGHFDLPHDSTVRRPIPRAAQPSARPPVGEPVRVAAATPTPQPAATAPVQPEPVTTAPTPAAVQPETVTAAPPSRPVRVAEATPRPVAEKPVPKPAVVQPELGPKPAAERPEPKPAAVQAEVAPAPSSKPVRVAEAAPKPAARHNSTTPAAKPDEPYTFDEVPPPKKGSGKGQTAASDTKGKAGTRGKADADEDRGTGRRGKGASDDDRTASGSKSRTARDEGRTGGKARADDEDNGTRSKKGDKDTGKGKSAPSKSKGRADADEDGKGRSAKSKKGEGAAPRVYVQVAGGANKADMDKAWDGVRKKAPELMKGRTASTTPLRATNRLMVGPFKDEAEAQAFVNKAAGKGVSGFVVKTDKGQKVEKIDGGQ